MFQTTRKEQFMALCMFCFSEIQHQSYKCADLWGKKCPIRQHIPGSAKCIPALTIPTRFLFSLYIWCSIFRYWFCRDFFTGKFLRNERNIQTDHFNICAAYQGVTYTEYKAQSFSVYKCVVVANKTCTFFPVLFLSFFLFFGTQNTQNNSHKS